MDMGAMYPWVLSKLYPLHSLLQSQRVMGFCPIGTMGQSPLLSTPPGDQWLELRGTARIPAAIPLSPLVSTSPSEELASNPTETHGGPCTPPAALRALPHRGGQFPASQLCILARAHADAGGTQSSLKEL